MSFLDSWLARQEGRDDSLGQYGQNGQNCPESKGHSHQLNSYGQNTQNGQNSEIEAAEGGFGHIGHIGHKNSTEAKPGTCRKRLTSPGQAGALNWETLAAWKDEFPHLRPCPQAKNNSGDWLWVNRSRCQGCPWAVTDEARTLQ